MYATSAILWHNVYQFFLINISRKNASFYVTKVSVTTGDNRCISALIIRDHK